MNHAAATECGVRRKHIATLAIVALVTVSACGGGAEAAGDGEAGSPDTPSGSTVDSVRLGYFANVTHAPAIIGVEDGLFAAELGDVTLETNTFTAGTEVIEALFSGAIDMSFIGPNPAINGFAQSEGEALRIVAGTTSGGAALVVAPEIQAIEDLAGTKIATPSLGNTQDVALRSWLLEQGLATDFEGGGDVGVIPQDNATTLETFQQGLVQGAWAPEPWATRLISEGGGHVLVNERDLWPDGQFVTTHLIVATRFLEENPGVVAAVIRGLVAAIDQIEAGPAASQAAVNAGIAAITGSELAPETITGAWENLEFTVDPIASSLAESAEDAVTVGLLEPVDLEGIYDLEILNRVLAELGLETIST